MVSSLVLKKISAASGLYFGVFLVMHLFSHYSTIFGMDKAMKNVMFFRKLYQNPFFEIGLFVSLVAHMMSNALVYQHRQNIERRSSAVKKNDGSIAKIEPPGSLELKGHRYTGYFLSLAIIGHASATRIVPYFILDDPSQFDYSFATYAQRAIFGPIFGLYLILLGMAGGWHLIYGTRSAITTLFLGSSVTGKPFPLALKPVAVVNHLLIVNAVLAITGVYYAVDTETKEDLYKIVYSYVPI
jgi:hypothetical protein